MATVEELAGYLSNPNVQKVLRTIGQAEGTVGEKIADPYRIAFGGGTFDSLDAHPNTMASFTQTDGKKNKTSAAGAYQFLKPTWDDVSGKLGLKDFSPRNQDIAALELINRAGALQDVLNGDTSAAFGKLGSTWASLPSSPYAQPKRSPGFIEQAMNAVIPAAEAAPVPKIDPSKVQWDEPVQKSAAPAIDVSKVQWDKPESGGDGQRGLDGVMRVEMSQESNPYVGAPPAQAQGAKNTGILGAIEGLGAGVRKMGQGIAQGFGDVPAGLGQSSMHQGQQILGAIDQLAGTNLSTDAQPNVAARDAEIAQREADYQAATPGSAAAGLGRLGGNLAFAMAGGPQALAAPMVTGAQAGARALPIAPRLGAALGTAAGSGLVGAGYGATAPVTSGDYDDQSTRNAIAGGVLGAVTPALGQAVGATGRYIGRNIKAAVAPFSDSGRQQIAENILARMAQGGPQKGRVGQFVDGVEPTMAEITGNPKIANLQRTIRDLEPTPFVAREEANQLARQDAMSAIRGTADDLATAKVARSAAAADDYLNTHVGIPIANTEYTALKRTPAFQSAFAEAERMAKNAGGSVETKVVNRTNANRGGQIGTPDTYVSGVGLQRIKMALDDQINAAMRVGENSKASNVLQVKSRLVDMMDREIPGYAEARQAYSAASREIDQMSYLQGMNLTDAQGNITLAKVQNALRNLEKAQQKPGMTEAKSVTADKVAALIDIRDDLLRQAQAQAGRSLGTNTAQNLAMQNMLSTMLPGRVGDVAGAIGPGAIAGGGLGLALGGPAGGAAGAVVGNRLEAAANALMRSGNEDIQNRLARLLLNEGGSGLSALQRAASPSRPLSGMSSLERLLYPSVSIGGSLGMGVKTPANAR
jgi:muramidase (phage lysozyme)